MNTKHIILFLILTTVLVIFSYELLDVIDQHKGFIIIAVLAIIVITDIAFMTGIFLRLMKSSHNLKK